MFDSFGKNVKERSVFMVGTEPEIHQRMEKNKVLVPSIKSVKSVLVPYGMEPKESVSYGKTLTNN